MFHKIFISGQFFSLGTQRIDWFYWFVKKYFAEIYRERIRHTLFIEAFSFQARPKKEHFNDIVFGKTKKVISLRQYLSEINISTGT